MFIDTKIWLLGFDVNGEGVRNSEKHWRELMICVNKTMIISVVKLLSLVVSVGFGVFVVLSAVMMSLSCHCRDSPPPHHDLLLLDLFNISAC